MSPRPVPKNHPIATNGSTSPLVFTRPVHFHYLFVLLSRTVGHYWLRHYPFHPVVLLISQYFYLKNQVYISSMANPHQKTVYRTSLTDGFTTGLQSIKEELFRTHKVQKFLFGYTSHPISNVVIKRYNTNCSSKPSNKGVYPSSTRWPPYLRNPSTFLRTAWSIYTRTILRSSRTELESGNGI